MRRVSCASTRSRSSSRVSSTARADRLGGDLVEDHPLDRHLGLEHLEQVPRDGLALAVLVGREQELVGVGELALQLGDLRSSCRRRRRRAGRSRGRRRPRAAPTASPLYLAGMSAARWGRSRMWPTRRLDVVARARGTLDRLRLRGRLDDHERATALAGADARWPWPWGARAPRRSCGSAARVGTGVDDRSGGVSPPAGARVKPERSRTACRRRRRSGVSPQVRGRCDTPAAARPRATPADSASRSSPGASAGAVTAHRRSADGAAVLDEAADGDEGVGEDVVGVEVVDGGGRRPPGRGWSRRRRTAPGGRRRRRAPPRGASRRPARSAAASRRGGRPSARSSHDAQPGRAARGAAQRARTRRTSPSRHGRRRAPPPRRRAAGAEPVATSSTRGPCGAVRCRPCAARPSRSRCPRRPSSRSSSSHSA